MRASQSLFTWIVTSGEGWHNYHHAFPWDSRMSEFGQIDGISTKVLDILVYLGLAYDPKRASTNVVYGHMKRHGDETGKTTHIEKCKERGNLFKKMFSIFN